MKDWVKGVRDAALRSLSQVTPSRYWREKLIVYLLRQEKRSEEGDLREAYGRLAHLGIRTALSDEHASGSGMGGSDNTSGSQESVGPFPLADVFTFVKFVKGGAW
jgi:hypothetical protein